RLVLPIAIRHRPEVKAGVLGLRGETMEQAELEAAFTLAFIGAGASIGRAGPLQHAARGDKLKLLPAVDPAGKTGRLDIGRRRYGIAHPAGEFYAARRPRRLHLGLDVG